MSDWKSGDPEVAFISWRSASRRHGGSALALRCSHTYGESHWRTQTLGEITDENVTDVRPLVVIDPENREHGLAHDEASTVMWCDSIGVGRSWSRVNAVRVLSEGVQP